MKKAALAGLGITLLLVIPILFVLTKSAAGTNRIVVITGVVLLFALWTALYVMFVDPLLRRMMGGIFMVRIEWRGPGNSIAWTAAEPQGCLREMLIAVFGYVFLTLWILPFAGVVFLVYRLVQQSQV